MDAIKIDIHDLKESQFTKKKIYGFCRYRI